MKDRHEPEIDKSDVPSHNLIGAVRYVLAGSPEVNAGSITVNASNGVVYLTGAVDTLREKEMASALATKSSGVTYVENDLVVSPAKPSSDHELLSRAQQALGGFVEPKIGVRMVESGQAYVTGTAESAYIAEAAVRVVESVPGISQVINEIDIASGEPIDDIDIANRVLDRLADDPRLHYAGIAVRADRGEVILDGEVDNHSMVESAGDLANRAEGVRRVVNRLTRIIHE